MLIDDGSFGPLEDPDKPGYKEWLALTETEQFYSNRITQEILIASSFWAKPENWLGKTDPNPHYTFVKEKTFNLVELNVQTDYQVNIMHTRIPLFGPLSSAFAARDRFVTTIERYCRNHQLAVPSHDFWLPRVLNWSMREWDRHLVVVRYNRMAELLQKISGARDRQKSYTIDRQNKQKLDFLSDALPPPEGSDYMPW